MGDQEQLQYIYDTSKGASEDVINNRINEMVLRTRRAKEFILADYEKRKQAANQDHTTDEDSEHQEVADKDGAKDGDSEHQEAADKDDAVDEESEHQEAADKDDATDKDGDDFEKPVSCPLRNRGIDKPNNVVISSNPKARRTYQTPTPSIPNTTFRNQI